MQDPTKKIQHSFLFFVFFKHAGWIMLNMTQEWEVMKDMTAAVSTLIFLSTFLHLYMTAGIKSRHI